MTDENEARNSEAQEGEVIFNAEELTQTRRVDAVEHGRQFFTVDQDLNPILAGYTQLIDFDKGKAKGLVFIDGDNKQYSLGNPSKKKTHHTIVQHHQVLAPIRDVGFEVANLVQTRGGSSLFALFRHPEITMTDTMDWDSEQYVWDGNSRGDSDLLHLSVAAWLSPNIGKSLRVAVGFFRNICANGLVSSILGLGHLRMTHNQFSKPKMDAFAESALTSLDDFQQATFSPKVLNWVITMADAYQRDPERALALLPGFAKQPFNSAIASQPNHFQDSMLYQMNMASQSSNDLTTLDVLNMVTNVSNEAENDSLYFKLESISESFVKLLEVAAFKQGLEFPSDILTNVNVR